MTTSQPVRAGVVGYPISHSLSPYIHNYWLKRYGIAGQYDAIEVPPEDLKTFLNSLPAKGFNGVNLTLPHKVEALSILGNVDPFAEFIGAVNTVIINDGHFLGTNTDFVGFVRNIETGAPGFDFAAGKAVLLGAGGAARAVVFALASMKAPEIVITNRSYEKAEAIAADMRNQFGLSETQIYAAEWESRSDILADTNLLVNTTSLGMKGQPELEISLDSLPKRALVTDIVYNPLITPLLAAAETRGNVIVDGLGMLLYQAAPGFEAWFGTKPEVTDELREIVLQAL